MRSKGLMMLPAAGAEETRPYGLVVIAASAGGLTALSQVLASLPSSFPLPVAIVQHIDPRHQSLMASILARRTALNVHEACEDDTLLAGHVYVAPPGAHLIVSRDRVLHLTRTAPVNRANTFFESILTGVRGDIVVVDRDLRVLAWNHRSEDLWGVRREEALGQNLLNLDIGLPGAELRPAIRRCLAGEVPHSEAHVRATNRRGRAIDCRVTVTPLVREPKVVSGAIVIVEEEAAEAAAEN